MIIIIMIMMMGHKIGFVLKYFQSSKLLAINVFVAIIVLYHYHITFSSSSSPFYLLELMILILLGVTSTSTAVAPFGGGETAFLGEKWTFSNQIEHSSCIVRDSIWSSTN